MSARRIVRGVTTLCSAAVMIFATSVYAQDYSNRPMPTIADCPRGYRLGVQDTDAPQPFLNPQPDPATTTVELQRKWSEEQVAQNAAAPRQFITGCVAQQPVQQQQR